MKVIFEKDKLNEVLSVASGISQSKNTTSYTDGILFECPPMKKYGQCSECDSGADVCRISVFDLEKGFRCVIPCKIEEEGSCVINTNKIAQIIRVMPDGDITIEVEPSNNVKIDGYMSHFEITAAKADEFPTMPDLTGENFYVFTQGKLRKALSAVTFAVAQNDTRQAFNGALFSYTSGRLDIAACDGNRLAVYRLDTGDKNEGKGDISVVIPGKFLTELMKMLKDSDDTATMTVTRKHVIFHVNEYYFLTLLIDAEFIDYKRLLPKKYMTQLYVSRDEFSDALDRALIVTEEKLGAAKTSHVKLEVSKRKIKLSSISSGSSVDAEVAVSAEGNDLAIGFNCKFLSEVLKSCPASGETLRIRFNTPVMGVVIEPSAGTSLCEAVPDESVFGECRLNSGRPGTEEDEFMYFVMPIRMNR